MFINTSCSLFVVRHELINRIIVSSDISSDLIIYPAISHYHFKNKFFWSLSFPWAVSIRWHFVHHLLLQSESAILYKTHRTSKLLATEQPWPQYISLQNLGQRVYHKSAGCEWFEAASVWCVSWSVTERYWGWHWSVAQTSPISMPAFELQEDSFNIFRDIN